MRRARESAHVLVPGTSSKRYDECSELVSKRSGSEFAVLNVDHSVVEQLSSTEQNQMVAGKDKLGVRNTKAAPGVNKW
jgi:hypothetical protein